jgi:hypothetical protein
MKGAILACAIQVLQPTKRKIIDPADAVAGVKQAIGQLASDETCNASDKVMHG